MGSINKNHKLTTKGFTLIEVVLVLAIGGLIFLLAFLAFQQVSRNRRDTQRRSDVKRMVGYIEEFAANNNGAYPCATHYAGTLAPTFGARTLVSAVVSYDAQCPGMRMSLSQDNSFNTNAGDLNGHFAYKDPKIGPAHYMIVRNQEINETLGRLGIYVGAKCNGSALSALDDYSAYAVRVKLESGANNYACADNS